MEGDKKTEKEGGGYQIELGLHKDKSVEQEVQSAPDDDQQLVKDAIDFFEKKATKPTGPDAKSIFAEIDITIPHETSDTGVDPSKVIPKVLCLADFKEFTKKRFSHLDSIIEKTEGEIYTLPKFLFLCIVLHKISLIIVPEVFFFFFFIFCPELVFDADKENLRIRKPRIKLKDIKTRPCWKENMQFFKGISHCIGTISKMKSKLLKCFQRRKQKWCGIIGRSWSILLSRNASV